MEKDIKLGALGDLDVKLEAGVLSISVVAAVPGDLGVSAGAQIKCDSQVLLDKIFAAIEAKASPGVAVIEESVKGLIKKAAAAL